VWEASLNHVKDRQQWCPTCAKGKPTLDVLRAHARQRGGDCLADSYPNCITKLPWACAKGHQWEATWHAVHTQGRWCKLCTAEGQRLSFAVVQEAIEARGGRCLSTEYKSNQTPLRVKCGAGHEWGATYANLSRGKWCPQCADVRLGRQPGTIDRMHVVAGDRGGECLSVTYVNSVTPLRWRCREGHEWRARPGNVINNGTWCPDCLHKGEGETRALFERLTGKRFPSRTSVLPNPRYQLDGYCSELRIAFEHHGKQHYAYVPYFHRGGPEGLEQRRATDVAKAEMCDSEQIVLITVPYDLPDKEAFIRKELYALH
jgi:hypothetical protein